MKDRFRKREDFIENAKYLLEILDILGIIFKIFDCQSYKYFILDILKILF